MTTDTTAAPITPEALTRNQSSALLYVETCCVDFGGLLEGTRMNEDDRDALDQLAAAGALKWGRIPGRLLGSFQRQVTHWCDLTDEGWALAHQLRRARAARCNGPRDKVNALLAEREAANG